MARNNDRDRSSRRVPKDAIRRGRKKVCIFCREHMDSVDYKDVSLLRKFMSERGKIRARRVSGNCAQHQRKVALAIKTARELALLPYTQRTTSDRPGARGGGRPARSDVDEVVDLSAGEEEAGEYAAGDLELELGALGVTEAPGDDLAAASVEEEA